jgi:ADP-ribose pyrophosphatase
VSNVHCVTYHGGLKKQSVADTILAETRFLRCIDRDGWSFVERPNATGVVALVAVTRDGRLVMVEQRRIPVGGAVIELPAGLVGDEPGRGGEVVEAAAERELIEETGYRAGSIELIARCATSPGVTSEIVSFFLATELEKVGPGGGTDDEQILVHEVPLPELRGWLRARESEGILISATLATGLFFAGPRIG